MSEILALESQPSPPAVRRPAASWPAVAIATAVAFAGAVVVAGFEIPGSQLWPWQPAMIDLDVYRRTGTSVIAGQDFMNADGLPWIYPPFAAFFAVPLAWLPVAGAQLLWLALCALCLVAILYRFGLNGWKLTVLAAAVVLLFDPVRQTLGYGQVGIFLVALLVLDAVAGPRILGRRYLPAGWLTGIATAVKLTPAVIAVYNFFSARLRPAFAAFGAFALATLVGVFVFPRASVQFFSDTVSGSNGMAQTYAYSMNQSVIGVWSRLFGIETPS
ncbi:MAG: DUF2029 domain-containing protein, partial [Propionibacteriaceae bacterium]|nr:DUF2029 domain-containing protein [Propionibacteriaceae bacterium]